MALQGAANRTIQAAMSACVRRWRQAGTRVVGVVEAIRHEGPRGADSAHLVDVTTGATFPLFQDLGRHSVSCHLQGAGVVAACAAVLASLDEGCDLVVLSKFGRLEAERAGLHGAFQDAAARGLPILTAVAPAHTARWLAFAGATTRFAPPDERLLDAWWRAVTTARLAGNGTG